MKNKIKKVAVLGSGVMGAQIAGHLANAGIPSLLFDLKKSDVENSKESLKKLKPAPLYIPKSIELIRAHMMRILKKLKKQIGLSK